MCAVSWLCIQLISLSFDKFNCQPITKQNTIPLLSVFWPLNHFYLIIHLFYIDTPKAKTQFPLSLHWLSLSINNYCTPLYTPHILQKSAPSISLFSLNLSPLFSPRYGRWLGSLRGGQKLHRRRRRRKVNSLCNSESTDVE